MKPDFLLSSALHQTTNAISYTISHELADLFPDKYILYGETSAFDFDAFVRAGLCMAHSRPDVLEHTETYWKHGDEERKYNLLHGWHEVTWEGQPLSVVLLTWTDDGCTNRRHWIIGEKQEVTEAFLDTVCAWSSEVRGEVLVYENGDWEKDADLFRAIKNATFDNLVLPGRLKQEIQDDFRQFLNSRDVYERYRLPWKRGVLLIGPPGNGKTHAVKALVNWLDKPCLYVKSLKSRYGTDHQNIRSVFRRARHTTPCILVLEDLNSLIDDKNRSFFLNELDGFASNTGIIVVATTNHPERLDVAIVERPSRFDRKYHFDLPAEPERRAYIAAWNQTIDAEMHLTADTLAVVVEQTQGFSFAYLKELFVASMMRWISAPQRAPMDTVIREQTVLLREQMHSMNDTVLLNTVEEDED